MGFPTVVCDLLRINGYLQIRDVGALLIHLARSCPKLQYLSLVGNPGWPDTRDARRYKKYR